MLTREAEPEAWARIQSNLANAYTQRVLGDQRDNCERAIECHRAALEVRTRDNLPIEWANTMLNMGNAYAKRVEGDKARNAERAIECYMAGEEVFTRLSSPVDWAIIQLNIASAYLKRSASTHVANVDLAIKYNLRALEVFTASAMPSEHTKAQLNLGRIFSRDGHWPEAAGAYRAALLANDLLYKSAMTPEARQSALSDTSGVAAELAFALAKIGGAAELREAVLALEVGRARSLAEALRLDEAVLHTLPQEHKLSFETAREELQRLQAESRMPETTSGRRTFLQLSAALRKAYQELEQAIDRIRMLRPDFLPQTSIDIIENAAAQNPLTYLICARSGGMALIVKPGEKLLIEWLPQLTQSTLRSETQKYFAAFNLQHTYHQSWLQALDQMLAWLWDSIMHPVLKAIAPKKEMVLIPGGLLSLLPLHAARTRDPDALSGWLYAMDFVRLRYAPNARAFLAARSSAATADVTSLLAIDEPLPVRGPALVNSTREVDEATRHFVTSLVLRHGDATREAALMYAPDYTVLHFSCHGIANFIEPLNSGLMMVHDQVLSVRDFLGCKLFQARLAVLSACATGIVGSELPDEAIGLPSGLLQAGVDGIVASLWLVSEMSTMILMSRFYEVWRAQALEPSDALRIAQLWMRDTTNSEKMTFIKRSSTDPSQAGFNKGAIDRVVTYLSTKDPDERTFSHPFHWGAFTYTGA